MSFRLLYILIISAIIISGKGLYAQELSDGELELELKAFEYFKNEQYEEAMPLFSQLLSLYPKQPDYNYGYGVCLIETNTDPVKAIDYLKFALSTSDNPVVYFYIGKAYHLTYKFDEALRFYGSFKSKATSFELKKFDVDKYMDMARNGSNLIRYISDLIVFDNKKIKKENFQYSYELDDFGGRLIIKPAEYITKVDMKKGDTGLMFVSDSGYVYYSSYGNNKKGSRDIYRCFKQPDGTMTEPERLSDIINSEYDEDYPYIRPDGITLYFSSNGHNSMGGYDIFKSVYDTTKTEWSEPINMDFPINSPYDDYLYISDLKENFAYFASNRETSGDRISVYKIEIDKNPIERESKDYEEIIQKSKLEISPLAMRNKFNENNNLLSDNTDKTSNDKALENKKKLTNFKPVEYSNDMSFSDILSEAQNDSKQIENDIKESDKNSIKTLVIAQRKMNEAESIRKQSERLYETDPEKAKELADKAARLEQEAILAYNISEIYDNSAKDLQDDAQKSKTFADQVSNNSDRNVEKLVSDLNKIREELNNSYNRNLDINTQIEERSKLRKDKDQEIQAIKDQIDENDKNLADIENQMQDIQGRINNTNDQQEKNLLENDLSNLLQDYNNLKKTQKINEALIEKKQKEKDYISDEIEMLGNLKTEIEASELSEDDLIAGYDSINRDKLKADIYDKELLADKNKAETLNEIIENVTLSDTINQDLIAENTNTNNSEIQNVNNVSENINKTDNNVETNSETNGTDNNTEDNINLTVDNVNDTKQDTNNYANQNNENTNNRDSYREFYTREEYLNAADSIDYLVDMKKRDYKNTEDPDRKKEIKKQINQLEKESKHNRNKAEQLLVNVSEQDNIAANNLIEQQENQIDENPVFSFGNNSENPDSKVNQYQKELFNKRYYENLANEQEKRIEILKVSYDNAEDENIKQDIQNKIDKLQKKLNYSRNAAVESGKFAETLKHDALDQLDNKEMSPEMLMVKATEYKSEHPVEYSDVQKETIDYTRKDRNTADKNLEDWNKRNNEIIELKDIAEQTEDKSERKMIDKSIKEKQNEANDEFMKINDLYSKANNEEYVINKNLLDQNRVVGNRKDVLLANHLEKESELYKEKAGLIRSNATLIKDNKERCDELLKAKNYELIAINKQKQALDIYYDNSDLKTILQVENHDETNTDNQNQERNSITLLPEEEKQLKEYRKENHVAETLETEAKKDLKEIETAKAKAAELYSAKEKNKMLKGTDKKEEKALENLETAYNKYGISDSLKYNLYKNQIKQMSQYLSEIGNNKKISDQFSKEADYYFEQARMIRNNAKKIEERKNRIDMLAKAVDFEKKALDNQEMAVDILMNMEPVDFASVNTITKVDRLEVLDKPVDVRDIKEVQSDMIIKNINLPEDDLIALDKANETDQISDKLKHTADSLENRINELKNIIETTDNNKVKSKAEKEIKKTEKDMYANKFSSADLDALANDTKYWVYKDHIKEYRKSGNSQDVRQAKQLERNANADYNKAKKLRDRSFFTENPDDAYDLLKQADSLELEAINELEKSYSIYLDLQPVDSTMLASNNYNNDRNVENDLIVHSDADITPIDNDTTSDVNDRNYLAENQINENNDTADNNTDNTSTENSNDVSYNNTNTNDNIQTNETDSVRNLVVENNTDNTGRNAVDSTNYLADNNNVTVNTGNNNNNTDNTDNTDNTSNGNDGNTENSTSNDYGNNTGRNATVNNDNNTETNNNDNETNKNVNTNNDINANANNTHNNLRATSTVLNYSVEPVSRYSAANPIPMNPELPEGIVFKVQIGAFRNPIPPTSFGGLSPISGEKLAGSAFTRYLVGLFNTYEAATLVQNEVKTMGYRDAFIVAYKDGKRIPLYQARNQIREATGAEADKYKLMVENEVNAVKNRTSTETNNNNAVNRGNNNEANNVTPVVTGKDLNKVNGLLYTVQIGVYKQAVTANDLYNLNPIYREKTQYGFTRYTTGVFNDYNKAVIEKDRIVKLGINDAFVTAYFNGKRITLAEANNIEESNGNDVFANEEPVKMEEKPVENNTPDLGDVNQPEISFRVQIGAYKEQVPNTVVADFIKVAANQGLDQYKDENGITIYSVGSYKQYDQAVRMKNVLINDGIKDAFVVAYNKDKKIPVPEALRLIGQ